MKPKLARRGERVVEIYLKNCDSCLYFEHKSNIEHAEARTSEEANSWHGRCRFLPSIVKKKREDWCGQYKKFNVFFYRK